VTSYDLTAIPAPERQDDPAFVDSFAQPAFKEHLVSLDFPERAQAGLAIPRRGA